MGLKAPSPGVPWNRYASFVFICCYKTDPEEQQYQAESPLEMR
jgi:hypothetical protein